MRKRGKVLVLFDADSPNALDHDYTQELKTEDWKTEAHVIEALTKLRCEYEVLGLHDDTDLLRQKLETFDPDIIFNMVEQFGNLSSAEHKITSFLELQGIPFTGCSAVGITLCKNKSIAKKILGFHRIRVPEFAVLPPSAKVKRPKRLQFPILIKPLKEEGSYGISQASFVETDEDFVERVKFIHEKFSQPAIAEEYIVGRELYVGMIGTRRLQAFPAREMVFEEVPEDEPRFATFKAKWDEGYRKRWGIKNDFAKLDAETARKLERLCKRIYRLLLIDGYARIDLRLTAAGEIVFIEANPNPMLARDEDFALSAAKAGLPFTKLIQRILKVGETTVRD
ncbi:MAG: ATP-grasp domain-containing protein [Planctomycetes bacterium]|nr:ATP-grasp domain-containing protein [Planctomycetota bacterium]